jgi:Na+-translocating ferredoxin:NAD+ oxidoreductase RnfG subunit
MKFKITPYAFFACFLALGTARAERLQSEAEALKASFPEALSFSTQAEAPHFILATGAKGHLLGRALVTEELGKHQPITFMVALDAKNTVRRVELLQYRERYGGGVAARRFMAQFEGKSGKDSLVVGKDIDGVSGATISSKAIARGVRKVFTFSQTQEEKK